MLTAHLLPLLFTILLEVPLVALLYPGRRARLALVCLLATSVTYLLMALVLPLVLRDYTLVVVTGELIAVVAEAGAYALADRERGWSRALVASALANGLSFGVSLLVQG